MLKIRLQRVGRKNDPSFRVVVLEGTEGPKSGSHVDQVGFYNAVTKQKSIDGEKARYWIGKGAKPSDTVYNLLITEGVLEGKKRNVLPSKHPITKETPAPEAAPVAAAPVAETSPEESAAIEPEPAVEAPEASAADPASEALTEEAPEIPAEKTPAPEAAPDLPADPRSAVGFGEARASAQAEAPLPEEPPA